VVWRLSGGLGKTGGRRYREGDSDVVGGEGRGEGGGESRGGDREGSKWRGGKVKGCRAKRWGMG